ncbi:hypothetical protein BVI2075_580035 [Burkholderia vietnamiensis]|nr:hypothetical protein BVI1335_1220036 [Burkholderia vietnamiensis]CAG9214306.1 hypothetical protein BVI2075_580035 [Burkholderia vietnamiensis]
MLSLLARIPKANGIAEAAINFLRLFSMKI